MCNLNTADRDEIERTQREIKNGILIECPNPVCRWVYKREEFHGKCECRQELQQDEMYLFY